MKVSTLSALLFPFYLVAPSAYADCSSTNNPFDDIYCQIQVFHQMDHQLNTDYAALHKMLNSSQQKSLRASEITWIKDRNSQCTQSDGGWDYVSMDCAVDMTNKRDQFIQQLQRECSSTGCVDSEIAKEFD